ncbi:unnamed protein product [Soboliphyme baturini]|uniref:Tumor protein D52 n=1 Tax=Soboliphyme baturini TaxID=241478 RepID=A0A183IJB8_9BILA|nr:unnamed protein product [Soboliphyme baturini]
MPNPCLILSQTRDTKCKGEHDADKSSLTESEKEELIAELKRTEDDIQTLQQVIAARLKHANEIKRKLAITPWQEISHDVSEGLRTVKESEAFHVTNDLIHQATDALSTVGSKVSSKIGQLRSTSTFKSFEERVGSAYANVKNKIVTSTSSERLGPENDSSAPGQATAARSQPTTPPVPPS